MVEINANGGQNKWPRKNIFRISINVLDLENVAKLYICNFFMEYIRVSEYKWDHSFTGGTHCCAEQVDTKVNLCYQALNFKQR